MALEGMRICVTGEHSKTRKTLEGVILGAGGAFAKTISAKVHICMATEAEVRNATSKVTGARKHGIPIVREAWLDAVLEGGDPSDTGPYLLEQGGGGPGPAAAAAAVQPAKSAGPAVHISGQAANAAAKDACNVMLANKWKEGADPTGWVMSEKLDGMRAYWSGKNFFSRNGNQLNPPEWFVKDMPAVPLDGELWMGRGNFQKCMSIVRKQVPTEDWKFVQFLVFDAPKHTDASGDLAPYEERVAWIASAITPAKTKHCRAVGARACTGQADLEEQLRKVEAAGGEGLMLRQPGSLYEWKRSSTLLKVKTFFDEEAKVIGHKEGKGKNEGLMGALHCETPDGRQFDVGSGFTAAQRSRPPPVGSIVTYRFQELSKALHPRFPTYIDTREDLDWDEYVEEYEAPTKAESKLKRNHTLLFSESLGHRTDDGDEDDGGASGAAAAAAPAKRRKTAKAAKKPKAGLDPASMDPAKLRVVVNGEPCELRSHQRDAVTQWLGNQPTDMLHPPERKDFKGKLHYVDQSNDHHEIVKASAVWSWQSSNGGPAKWTPYSAADSEQLEAAFEAGSGGDSFDPLGSVNLGNGYVVDLVRMVQHPEGAPKRVRRVQRSGPAAAKASNPYAAAKVKKAKPAADVIDLADDMETDDAAAAGQKQFALTAVAQPPPPPKVAAKYTKPRGIQPKQILVPDDGQEIVLGRGTFGITDPYMSKRQAAVSTVQRQGGETALRFTALGTNGCLYRKVGMASGAWEKLATKTTGGGDEEGDEQASDGVMLVDGDELCLLADKTMRFAVVDARSVGP